MSGQFIPVKSENKSPQDAVNLIRKLQLIQQALMKKQTNTENSEDQETQETQETQLREETGVASPQPGRRRKGKKKRRNRLQEARNTLEESGETQFRNF